MKILIFFLISEKKLESYIFIDESYFKIAIFKTKIENEEKRLRKNSTVNFLEVYL